MSVGIKYDIEFLIKDKKALEILKKMEKQADEVSKKLGGMGKIQEQVAKARPPKNPYEATEKGAEKARKATEKLKESIHTIAEGFLLKFGSDIFSNLKKGFQDFANIDFDLRGAAAKSSTKNEMENVLKDYNKLTQQVGGNTKFRNIDVSKAIDSAATLGLMNKEIQAVLPQVANLAQAFNSDLNGTLERSVFVMNTYRMQAQDLATITDMQAMTAKSTAADLERLAEGFKYVGLTAKSMNIPLESAFAVLGKLNDVGLTGSQAGTAFNNFLVQLSKNYNLVEKMIGKSLTDQSGKLKPIEDIFQTVGEKFKELKTDTEKTALAMDLFGVRGSRAFFAFLEEGTSDLTKLKNEIKDSAGTTTEMAKFMMEGSGGAIETFLSTLESTFQSVFGALNPLIIPVFKALTSISNIVLKINQQVPELMQIAVIFGSLVIGKAVLLLAIQKLKIFVGMLKSMFLTAQGTLNWGRMLGIIGLIAIVFIAIKIWEKFQEKLKGNEEAQKHWNRILELSKKIIKEIVKTIISFFKALLGVEIATQKSDEKTNRFANTLKNIRSTMAKWIISLQKSQNWIKENSEKIKEWGENLKTFLKITGGILIIATMIKIVAGAVTILNAAFWLLSANPIILIIAAIVAVVLLLVLGFKKLINWLKKMYQENETFRRVVDKVWSFIKTTIANTITNIVTFFQKFISKIKEMWQSTETARNAIGKAFSGVGSTISSIVSGIISGIKTLIEWVGKGINKIKELNNSKVKKMEDNFTPNAVKNAYQGTKDYIMNQVKNAKKGLQSSNSKKETVITASKDSIIENKNFKTENNTKNIDNSVKIANLTIKTDKPKEFENYIRELNNFGLT